MTDAHSLILWLHDPRATHAALVGPKAARLAQLMQAGVAVPPGFVLTRTAHETGWSDDLIHALYIAYQQFPQGAVAVRSSAIAEDTDAASYAGMQETVLGVVGEDYLSTAINMVWSSYTSARAEEYRAHAQGEDAGIAVIVQWQVKASVAGVAFARDPLTGANVTVIEAVEGLGEKLVSGQAEPQRWRGTTRQDRQGGDDLLSPAQVQTLRTRLETTETLFGSPQDIEWAYEGEQFWVLQSRPITTLAEDWFTDHLPNDEYLWGAAFLNERFTLPVSPLGWTLVATPLETLAFRAPLELLGGADLEEPLLKLWQGHPYSRVEVWQRVYKLFPDWLLPDDAVRFFPDSDTSLRHAPAQPTYGPHLVINALKVLTRNWNATAPWQNPKGWARYEEQQDASLLRWNFEVHHLQDASDPISAARKILKEVAALTDQLLEYHRWSLLYADVFYSLLRRWLSQRYGEEAGAKRLHAFTTAVESPTTQMNRTLNRLVNDLPPYRLEVETAANGAPFPTDGDFWEAVHAFLRTYGHRFMSLDIYDAPWEADHAAFARFLLTLTPTTEATPPSVRHNALIRLTRDYMRLREAQRFYWQQLLAVQRRVIVFMGDWWTERGQLSEVEDVFGLTWQELLTTTPEGDIAAERMERFRQLRREAALQPAWHYPEFLRGTTPLMPPLNATTLQGRPVSPGVARGPARLVASPNDFARVQPGDILVTTAPDPGWTPLFSTVAGMVTERGGQLSHGAVVAREYHLPAVSGIPGLLATIQDGEILLVDGTKGLVMRE